MKSFVAVLSFSVMSLVAIPGQSQDKHTLDGTWVRYKYDTHGEVRLQFFDGKVMWKWLDENNPEAARDAQLSDKEKLDALPYRWAKAGDHIYVINWMHEPTSSYVTIVFNFKDSLVCGSAILSPRSKDQGVLFDKGIIREYVLVED
jgi:hypothetical protein